MHARRAFRSRAGTVTAEESLPAILPVIVEGLNHRWCSVMLDREMRLWRPVAMHEAAAWAHLDLTAANPEPASVCIGHPFTCDDPELFLTLVQTTEGVLHVAWSGEHGIEWTCYDATSLDDGETWRAPQVVVPGECSWLGDIAAAGRRIRLTYRVELHEGHDAIGPVTHQAGVWRAHELQRPTCSYPPVLDVGPDGSLHLARHDVAGRAWYARMDAAIAQP